MRKWNAKYSGSTDALAAMMFPTCVELARCISVSGYRAAGCPSAGEKAQRPHTAIGCLVIGSSRENLLLPLWYARDGMSTAVMKPVFKLRRIIQWDTFHASRELS